MSWLRSVISTREFGSALRRGELRPEEASLLRRRFSSRVPLARAISVRRFSRALARAPESVGLPEPDTRPLKFKLSDPLDP